MKRIAGHKSDNPTVSFAILIGSYQSTHHLQFDRFLKPLDLSSALKDRAEAGPLVARITTEFHIWRHIHRHAGKLNANIGLVQKRWRFRSLRDPLAGVQQQPTISELIKIRD